MKHYDIIIIWSGGGTKLRPLADLWKTIAIIEKEKLGGTCLNKWCIPSKMLIYPSDLATSIREHAANLHVYWGENVQVDFKALVNETQQRISADSNSIEPIYNSHKNITLYKWHAKFLENKILEVNSEMISAETIYIATGSVPDIPNIQWLEWTPYMTSKEVLANSDLPKKMIVIGGWYIAVELWHVYWSAGCDVHFLVRSGMIKAEDRDIRSMFEKDFSERYNVHFWVFPVKVEYKDKVFYVTLNNGEVMDSEALFVATGVRPMTDGLWLENTGITLCKNGFIEVDTYLETKVPGIFALWDVIWNYMFRHSVNYEGEYLLREYMKLHISWSGKDFKRSTIKYPPVPHAIFSYPQIAWVWKTEDELISEGKEKWKDYEIALHNYKNSAMWSAMKSEVGFVKLIADIESRQIIWAHIIGEKSSDIIHMMIVVISAKMTVDFMLEKMIFIHPALSEVIRNAARTLAAKLSL